MSWQWRIPRYYEPYGDLGHASEACGVGKDDYRPLVVGGQLAGVRPGVHGRGRGDADGLPEEGPDGLGG